MNPSLDLTTSGQSHARAGRSTDARRPLTKFERIQLVKALGLNTEDDILITSEGDWRRQSRWLSKFREYTVRTYREDTPRGTEPYFAVIDADEFENHRGQLLSQGWKLIIAAPVDPKDAVLAGTILRDGSTTEVDIVRGTGSVTRQVTHDGRIDKHWRLEGDELTGDQYVDEALNKVRESERRWSNLDALKHAIYEFSYYLTKVGHKKQHAIFWEITGLNRMDPGIALAEVLERQL